MLFRYDIGRSHDESVWVNSLPELILFLLIGDKFFDRRSYMLFRYDIGRSHDESVWVKSLPDLLLMTSNSSMPEGSSVFRVIPAFLLSMIFHFCRCVSNLLPISNMLVMFDIGGIPWQNNAEPTGILLFSISLAMCWYLVQVWYRGIPRWILLSPHLFYSFVLP